MTGAAQGSGSVEGARNRPALVSAWAAFLGVCLILGVFLTPVFWLLYGGFYTFLLFVFGIVAVLAGHLGRRRGKALGGRDRGTALLGILAGWGLIFFGLLLVLAYAGLMAGLAVLVDSAS
ncbi:hypothetical protein GCM10020256_12250 [Streptomyces thermocoprophilus]